MSGPLFRRLQRQSPLTNFSSKLTSSVSHLSPLFHTILPKRILDLGSSFDSRSRFGWNRSRFRVPTHARRDRFSVQCTYGLFVFELAESVKEVNGWIVNATICQSCSRRVLYYVTNYFRFRLLVRNRVRREFCH